MAFTHSSDSWTLVWDEMKFKKKETGMGCAKLKRCKRAWKNALFQRRKLMRQHIIQNNILIKFSEMQRFHTLWHITPVCCNAISIFRTKKNNSPFHVKSNKSRLPFRSFFFVCFTGKHNFCHPTNRFTFHFFKTANILKCFYSFWNCWSVKKKSGNYCGRCGQWVNYTLTIRGKKRIRLRFSLHSWPDFFPTKWINAMQKFLPIFFVLLGPFCIHTHSPWLEFMVLILTHCTQNERCK